MLLQELENICKMTSGKQHEYFQKMLESSHVVNCKKMSEILPKHILECVNCIDIKTGECYRNATLISQLSKDIHYVEGRMEFLGIPIDHAFNEYKGNYFDVTREIALHEVPGKDDEYLCIGIYDFDDVIDTINNTNGFYGGIWSKKYHYKDRLKIHKVI